MGSLGSLLKAAWKMVASGFSSSTSICLPSRLWAVDQWKPPGMPR